MLTLQHPVWLAVGLAVIAAAAAAARLRGRWGWGRVGRRAGVLAALAIALAGPAGTMGSGTVQAVILCDVSQSMGAVRVLEPGDPARWFGAWEAGDAWRVIPFAADAGAPTTDWTRIRRAMHPEDRSSLPETDVAAGLRAAAAALEGGTGAVVLWTDGLETTGDAAGALLELRRRGIPVHCVIPPGRDFVDVRVEEVSAPRTVRPGEAFQIEAVVSLWAGGGAGALEVRVEAVAGLSAPQVLTAALPPGRPQRFVFPCAAPAEKDAPAAGISITVRAALTDHPAAEREILPDNNRMGGRVRVGGATRVRVLRGAAGSAIPALLGGNPRFRMAGDAADPTAQCDVLVLDGVPASGLGPGEAERIARAVEEDGLGLVMLGGAGAFGAGGYAGTPIERVLPVDCRPPDAAAIAIVLDASGSMQEADTASEDKWTLARRAAVAVLDRAAPADAVAVWTFSVTPAPAASFGPAPAVRTALGRSLEGVRPRGGTLLEPALAAAAAGLRGRPELRKILLLVSDGETTEPPEAMTAAGRSLGEGGIRLIIAAPGRGDGAERLHALARAAGGALTLFPDYRALGEVLAEALRRERGWVEEGDALPVRWLGRDVLGLDVSPPPVTRLHRCAAKDRATTIAKAGGPPPRTLWALARSGRGKTAALATALDPDWAPGWADWPGLSAALERVLHWAAGEADRQEAWDAALRLTGGDGDLLVTAPEGDESVSVGAEWSAGGRRERIALSPRGRRAWEGRVRGLRSDWSALLRDAESPDARILLFSSDDPAGTPVARLDIQLPHPPEWRALGASEPTLAGWASAGGGRLLRRGEAVPRPAPAGAPRDLALLFAGLAAVLILWDAAAPWWAARRAGGSD